MLSSINFVSIKYATNNSIQSDSTCKDEFWKIINITLSEVFNMLAFLSSNIMIRNGQIE